MNTLCIVGKRGSGKTTVANALLGAVVFPAFAGRPTAVNVSLQRAVSVESLCVNASDAVNCTADGESLIRDATFAEISRLGTAASPVAMPPQATALVISPRGASDPANVDVQETADTSSLPENAAYVAVLSSADVVQARHRMDVTFGLPAAGALRVLRTGLIVVNVFGASGAEEHSRLRSLASTLLGIEASRVIPINARTALAQTLIPNLDIPQCIHDLRRSVRDVLHRRHDSAGPKHHIETAGRFVAAANDEPAPDRYVPKALAHRFRACDSSVIPRCLLPSPSSADEDRYIPKAQQSMRIAAELVANLNAYAPKAAAPATA